jgi:hypothetical protein
MRRSSRCQVSLPGSKLRFRLGRSTGRSSFGSPTAGTAHPFRMEVPFQPLQASVIVEQIVVRKVEHTCVLSSLRTLHMSLNLFRSNDPF